MNITNLIKPVTVTIIIVGLIINARENAFAQNINEQVTVTAAYEPSIPDANKINIQPPENETDVKVPVMTYENEPVQMMVTLKPENIAPVKLVGEPLSKLYRNYAKVGLGSYLTPFVDLYASSLRSKTYSLGLHLKHISSSGEIKDYPIASNSLNQIELYGQKFLDQHTLSGDIGFRRNVVHHYGFLKDQFNEISVPETYLYSDDDLKQRFARINAGASIKSNYKEADKLNHSAEIRFKNVADLFDTRETEFSLKAGADKQFQLLEFTDNQQLGVTADLIFTGYKDSLMSKSSALVSIKPFISTTFNEYSIKAGLNISFVSDSISKAYLFPFAEGQLRIIEDALVVHAGITGGVKRESFNELSDINPFVQSILPLQYTRDKFTFYAGLRARAGSNIDFNILLRSSFVENATFFINDYSMVPYNRFTLVHDNGKVFKGRVEAEYHTAEHIIIKAFAQLESWSLDTLDHAYHTPSLTFGADAMYQIQNKIIVRANVAAHGQQYSRVMETPNIFTTKTLDGFLDASIGLEYRYTKVLSAFLNFNNVGNTRYFLWNNYPSYRFNLMGGITYSF